MFQNRKRANNVGGVVKLFNRCGWQAESAQDASLPHQFMLVARQVSERTLTKSHDMIISGI